MTENIPPLDRYTTSGDEPAATSDDTDIAKTTIRPPDDQPAQSHPPLRERPPDDDPLAGSNPERLERLARLGFETEVRETLHHRYEADRSDLLLLAKTAEAIRGETLRDVTGEEPWCLLDGMDGFFGPYLSRVQDLEQRGLLTAVHTLRHDDSADGNPRRYKNQHYWMFSDEVSQLLADPRRTYPNESWLHMQTIGLLRTYFHLCYHTLGQPYTALESDGPTADLLVSLSDRARSDFQEYLPGTASQIAIEMMRDHNNTQHVLNLFRDYDAADEADVVWVFENVATANKWLRALQNADLMDFEREYSWSKRTNLKRIRKRVEAADYAGMRSVTTFHDVTRNWLTQELITSSAIEAAHEELSTLQFCDS